MAQETTPTETEPTNPAQGGDEGQEPDYKALYAFSDFVHPETNAAISEYAVNELQQGELIEDRFEGDDYDAPAGYDTYLRRLYGNYIPDPPPEEQVSHHDFRVWRR